MSWKKFIVCGDSHGDLICEETKKKFFDFVSDWKPNYRIHLGDFIDAPSLRKGCSIEDKSIGISSDFNAGMQFLQEYKPHYLTLGNHDDRIWLHSTHCADGILKEHCAKLADAAERDFSKLKIKWVPYHVSKYLMLPEGGPKLIHGFRATMYPAKSHFENWGPSICGHVHKPDTYVSRHIDGQASYSVACMANIDLMSYADRTPAKLAWRQGWLYGMINSKSGAWNAWHVFREGGQWISPMGVL